MPKEHRIKLAKAGSHVRVMELGEGPAVLFIPGAPNSGATWAALVKHFDGFRRLILDRPGSGLSDPLPRIPLPGDLLALGDTLVGDVLDGLQIARAHVVASSLGGFLALRFAAKAPDRIRSIVLMGCPAFAQGMKRPMFMRLMTLGIVRGLLNRLEPNVKSSESILRQVGHGESIDAGKIPAHFFDWSVALQKHTDTLKRDGAMIGNAIPSSVDSHLFSRYPTICSARYMCQRCSTAAGAKMHSVAARLWSAQWLTQCLTPSLSWPRVQDTCLGSTIRRPVPRRPWRSCAAFDPAQDGTWAHHPALRSLDSLPHGRSVVSHKVIHWAGNLVRREATKVVS